MLFKKIQLSQIKNIDLQDLDEKRLNTLLNGYDPFHIVLNSQSDPITLDISKIPYDVIDGRHRVYLARKKGFSEINAQVQMGSR